MIRVRLSPTPPAACPAPRRCPHRPIARATLELCDTLAGAERAGAAVGEPLPLLVMPVSLQLGIEDAVLQESQSAGRALAEQTGGAAVGGAQARSMMTMPAFPREPSPPPKAPSVSIAAALDATAKQGGMAGAQQQGLGQLGGGVAAGKPQAAVVGAGAGAGRGAALERHASRPTMFQVGKGMQMG